MTVARRMGMRRIFLECLPAHRELYEAFRFRLVPGRRNRVYNINKTMDLMEWEGPAVPVAPGAPTRGRANTDHLRDSGYLCMCENRLCPSGDPLDPSPGGRQRYAQFRSWSCPLAGKPTPWIVAPQDLHIYRQWP